MKWLTLTEIGHRARSKKGALKVSYKHWNQLYQATAKELRKAYEKKVDVNWDYCGLCRYYRISGGTNCRFCPLISCRAGSLYAKAVQQLAYWFNHNPKSDWLAWKRAAKAVRDKLKELMIKAEAKE